MALNFLRPGAPQDQPPAGILPTAKSAIFVAVLNAGITFIASPSYMRPCHGGGAAGSDGHLEQMYYDLYRKANFVTFMLGVALLFSPTVFRSPAWAPAAKWTVWVTKVLTGVTLTYSLSVLHSCLRMYAWPLFDWLSHGFYHHFFLTAAMIFLCNIIYFYSVYCYDLRHV
ncbi:unnamed protein product [Urochloa decumbens]|uniref:Uncharacterized protein n=1 Tax=Urochloa decumbens TaxID=240449 RepID=A0ABC9BHY7_9POAL